MDRRTLLKMALAAGVFPRTSYSAKRSPTGQIYFGYGATGVGGVVGPAAARLISENYEDLDYSFVFDTGRNTLDAVERVKNAGATDNWLLQTQSTQTAIFPSLYSHLSFDPLVDFYPLMVLGQATLSLTVGPLVDASVKTLDDYVLWVKDNPEYRNFGCVLYGSHGHLAGLMIAEQKRVAIRAQPYAGTSMMIEDLLDGVLAAGMVITGNARQAYLDGRLRSLGVTSQKPFLAWDTVPTLVEQGIEQADMRIWYGWLAPNSIPLARRNRLVEACKDLQLISEFQFLQINNEMEHVEMEPAQIQELMRREKRFYSELYQHFTLSRLS